jgi:cell division septation protein DedD
MASERRPPEDLQEAVAATLRRLRGEGGGSPQAGNRTEPHLSTPFGPRPVTPATPTNSSPTVVVTSPAATPAMSAKTPPEPEPDLLSNAGVAPEVPLSPASHASALKQFRVSQAAGGQAADKPRRGLLPYAAALAGLIVAAGVAWGAYRVFVGGAPKNGVVPTLVADQTPEKVPPTAADQNANEPADQDKTIYNEISPNSANGAASPKGEVLLPAPETPQKPPAPPQPAPSASEAASGGVNIDQPASVAATAPAGDAPTSATAPGTAPSGTPTVVGAPANSAAATPASGGAASDGAMWAPTGSNAAATPLAPTAPASGAMEGNTATASTAAPEPAQPSAAASPEAPASTATAPAATQAAALSTGSFRIQLAAVKSEAAAKKTWKRLVAKHQDLLGPLTMEIVRADLGGQGIYYRVQAGPFTDKTAARDACAKLKAQGQQCLVKP